MRIGIVGSRTFNDYELMKDVFYGYFAIENDLLGYGDITIISGGARGADLLAKKLADNPYFDYIEFFADWGKYGKSAGFKRNQQIVDNSDIIIAFWDGKSRGTQDTINKAKLTKKPTFIIYF